ncbi:MAG: hypothetical protein H0W33_02115 [Gammaproteobacteria bacterium]|nr:hypothetical protein [Gammaproteobacteria bacterium]
MHDLPTSRRAVSSTGWVIGLVSVCLPGCALADEKADELPDVGQAEAEAAHEQTPLRKELEHGYALLYEMVSSLQHADKLLLIKFESDEVKSITDDVSEAMGEIGEALEAMAKSDAPFDIEDTDTPRFERETREAMGRNRIKSFAPIVGKTGTDFERTLLLTQSGGLNQMLHMAEVLADAETDSTRKRFLGDAYERLDALYERVSELLFNQYYCKP